MARPIHNLPDQVYSSSDQLVPYHKLANGDYTFEVLGKQTSGTLPFPYNYVVGNDVLATVNVTVTNSPYVYNNVTVLSAGQFPVSGTDFLVVANPGTPDTRDFEVYLNGSLALTQTLAPSGTDGYVYATITGYTDPGSTVVRVVDVSSDSANGSEGTLITD